ncbi:MAG: glycosyltransferase family 2 protein [Solirubrobacteraceae bacterium]
MGFITLAFDGPALSRDQLLAAIAKLPAVPSSQSLERPSDWRLPRISVVIPTLMQRRETLRECLRALAALDYPDYEVIVVDNRPAGSQPVQLAGARVIEEPYRGISAARNRGLAVADGEIVAFTDDDVEVDPAWLLAIALRMHSHPDEMCVTGLVLPRALDTPAQLTLEEYYGGIGPQACVAVSHRMRRPPGTSGAWRRPATVDALADGGRVVRSFSLYAAGSFGPGANMAFRTAALRAFGGFDVRLGAGTPARGAEDLLMFARLAWAGHAIGFEPAAIARHNHYADEAGLKRQIEGYGTSWATLLLALVADDPRHLPRMLATVPRGLAELVRGFRAKLDVGQRNELVPALARLELRGIARGPAAYVRSHVGARR